MSVHPFTKTTFNSRMKYCPKRSTIENNVDDWFI